MVRRVLLAVVFVLLVGGPARAQLDPEPKQAYLWRVVLVAKPHPLITPALREQVKRDVLAALQPGLGGLGTVEVIDLADLPRDQWDPLWQQFDDKGFAALDSPRDLSGLKTHFLRIEVRGGQFLIEARQHDGFTGLASPVVRSQAVRAPELVGRTAGLLLDRDFGVTGTVEPIAGKFDEVKVVLRGGQLGSAKAVQVRDVFALAAVRKTNRSAPVERTATGKIKVPPPGSVPPPGYTSTPRDFTLLKVEAVEPDGSLRCSVLSRYVMAMPMSGGIVGYRCMKLGTVAAPVAVRLVGSDGSILKTASSVSVYANDVKFPDVGQGAAKDVCNFHPATQQFRTKEKLTNVACVTVSIGNGPAQRFPVPVLTDGPITLPFEVNPEAQRRAAFERSVLALTSAVANARDGQTVCFAAVSRLIDIRRNSEALARAKGGFERAEAEDKSLTDELKRLRAEGAEVPDKGEWVDAALLRAEQNLASLRKHNEQLKAHIATLEKVVARENDPATAAKQVQVDELTDRIKSLLEFGSVDEALAAYDRIITLLDRDVDAAERAKKQAEKDRLAAEWKLKDQAHANARDYLLKTWPGVTTIQDFRDSLPQLRAAVDVCKGHGDKWTARKLLAHFNAAVVKLNDAVALLDPASEADRKLLADAKAAGAVLAKMEAELTEFVK